MTTLDDTLRPSTTPPSLATAIDLLAHCPAFATVQREKLGPLAVALEWWYVPGGTRIIEPRDTCDRLCIVHVGRLRVYTAGDESKVVEDLGRGGMLGDTEILGDGIYGVVVDAVRDTEVAVMPVAAFRTFCEENPGVWQSVARGYLRHVAVERSVDAWKGESTTIVVLRADPEAPLHELAWYLGAAMASMETVSYLDAAQLDAQVSADPCPTGRWSQAGNEGWTDTDRQVVSWMDAHERQYRFVVYEADPELTPWTARCLRMADRVIIVARSTADPKITEIETQVLAHWAASPHLKADLVLIEPEDREIPVGTSDWLAWRPALDGVHHVKLGEPTHVARLARVLTGRAVGLVLGGGGARGNAHIGVIKALGELGIPVDLVGGTSAGGGIAGMLAAGRSPTRMIGDSIVAFVEMGPFHAYDLPWASLMRKEEVDAPARWLYGDINIEDLWLQFFCVSCDLASGQKLVFRRGRVWKAVRATTALPAVLPPMFLRGRVLVDGGVLDNTPILEMRKLNPGPNILVNVSPPAQGLVGAGVVDLPTNREVLLSMVHPMLAPRPVPNLAALIVSTMTVSTTSADPARHADLFVAPDIANYGIVDFDALDELVALGYNATMEAVEKQRSNPAFLEKFGLRPDDLPAVLPRMEVPRWQSAARRARSAFRRNLAQSAICCFGIGVLTLLVDSLVRSHVHPLPAMVAAAVAAIVPFVWARAVPAEVV